MYKSRFLIRNTLNDFKIEDRLFRYSRFIPKLYNYCKSLGFEPGKIMPSRAFCSDESQGYPIILITKHFGTFPFNHGMVGGVVATDRHSSHADHGKDMVIIQASHVGYDPQTKTFGIYRRACTEHQEFSANCGKIESVVRWYEHEYLFAKNNIFIEKHNAEFFIVIDNQLLDEARNEGLFLDVEKLIDATNGEFAPMQSLSTAKRFRASSEIIKKFEGISERTNIGNNLLPEHFYFKRQIPEEDIEGRSHLEINLINVMPWIVTSDAPLLEAAKVNTQVEFDRAFRTIVKEEGYQGKRVIYIAGLHIDISPDSGQLFPLTKFIPWAAFIQYGDGRQKTIEQDELYETLKAQTSENPDQIDMEEVISIMDHMAEVKIGD